MTIEDAIIWVGVVGLYLIGDFATTWYSIRRDDVYEANPLFQYVKPAAGKKTAWFVLVTVNVTVAAWAMMSYLTASNPSHKVPAVVLALLGVFEVVNNIKVGIK